MVITVHKTKVLTQEVPPHLTMEGTAQKTLVLDWISAAKWGKLYKNKSLSTKLLVAIFQWTVYKLIDVHKLTSVYSNLYININYMIHHIIIK